jgi:H+/Cl- antiporter ClcA
MDDWWLDAVHALQQGAARPATDDLEAVVLETVQETCALLLARRALQRLVELVLIIGLVVGYLAVGYAAGVLYARYLYRHLRQLDRPSPGLVFLLWPLCGPILLGLALVLRFNTYTKKYTCDWDERH